MAGVLDNFRPGTGSDPTSVVEISISCKNLLDKDVLSRSDPMCVVYTQPWGPVTGRWEEFLRTEIVWDNLNPEFTTKVKINFRFEEEQNLRFVLYDIDKETSDLNEHDFLGFADCNLARIVSSGYRGLTLPLIVEKKLMQDKQLSPHGKVRTHGTISLIAEELAELKEELQFSLKGRNLGSSWLSCCCSTRIFYEIFKVLESGQYIKVFKSESAPGPDPIWRSQTLMINTLCNGDKDRGLRIHFFAEGMNGYHTGLGLVTGSVNRFMSCANSSDPLYLTDASGNVKSSRLILSSWKLCPLYTFIDYIRSGTEIHCCFAIDMTGSNGDPNDPGSLHYIHAQAVNQSGNPYQQAIQAVGDIVKEYDKPQLFPVYGFGARLPPQGLVSHMFSINLGASPYCNGVTGVLEGYKNCIRQVQLWGPTNFAPIIREVASMALRNSNGPHYYVLLMITDGIISDMEETKEAIVTASTLPLSIIIVGVGGADFTAMEILDGDEIRLSYNGRFAARDIVQFVPYRDAFSWLSSTAPALAAKYSAGHAASAFSATKIAESKLAQEVLAEVPGQFTSYMKSRGIVPGQWA